MNLLKNLMAVLLLALCLTNTGYADTDNESSFWFMSLTRVNPGEKFEGFIDLQPRTSLDPADGDGQGQVQQFLARVAIGWKISESSTLFQGYAAITEYDPVKTEHRFFQELLSRFRFDGFNYDHRFRFEQRLLESIEEVGLRARSFSRFVIPVHNKFSIAINEELFWHLNDAEPGPKAGFDQNRLFLGVNYKVSPELSFDVGYQNQFIERRGGRTDVSNHIFFIGVLTNFSI